MEEMLEFANKYRKSIHSQNGEDDILNEVMSRMGGTTKKWCVEFGAPTKKWMSNIYHLHEQGHNCKWIDNDPKEGGILKAEITPENVNELVGDCDILSIDIDGNDFEVWKAYTGKPDIVIIEINSSLDPLADYFSQEKGCNFSAMVKLAKVKGYFLVCHTGNLIFCLNKHRHLFPDIKDYTPETIDLHFDRSWQ